MSGGVDSSLVAYLLKEEGYDIFGLTMKQLESDDKLRKPCCSLEDILDAKKICHDLKIPHYTINMRERFKKEVIDYFIDEYTSGNTPNPCIRCDREVKVREILRYAEKLGANFLATGHYSIIRDGKIYPSVDELKDQSYFLSQVRKEDIAKLISPLGGLTKEEVRALAKERNLVTSSKPDSQGVCFIEKDYKSFLAKNLKEDYKLDGEIVDLQGRVLGHHTGVHNYTVGQRRGIGLSAEHAYYVIKIEPKSRRIIVGKDEELFTNSLVCSSLNLYVPSEEIDGGDFLVKTRARDLMNRARVHFQDEERLHITFDERVRAITSGQVAVLHHPTEHWVVGSGIIL